MEFCIEGEGITMINGLLFNGGIPANIISYGEKIPVLYHKIGKRKYISSPDGNRWYNNTIGNSVVLDVTNCMFPNPECSATYYIRNDGKFNTTRVTLSDWEHQSFDWHLCKLTLRNREWIGALGLVYYHKTEENVEYIKPYLDVVIKNTPYEGTNRPDTFPLTAFEQLFGSPTPAPNLVLKVKDLDPAFIINEWVIS
jgi:hypothetical protein